MPESKIFLSPPDTGIEEIQHVVRALESGWVAPVGPQLDEFEASLCVLSKRKFAVAVSSGTAALHLSLLALGVKPGDRVICSTLTFVATANAILYLGAIPVFVDSNPASGNMSPELLELTIETLRRDGARIGAVIPVDFLGSMDDLNEVVSICERFDVPVLVDAAESVGSTKDGLPSGSFGTVSAFSFNGNKIMTTSSGGAILTDEEDLARRVRFLATQARLPRPHYEHSEIGFNYRLSNILAAIGIAQLEKLSEFVARRKLNRSRYRKLFQDLTGARVLGTNDSEDNCWLSAVVISGKVGRTTSSRLRTALEAANIESRPLWKPMHMQPLFRGATHFTDGTAEKLFLRGLALPSGSTLTSSEFERIEKVVLDVWDSISA